MASAVLGEDRAALRGDSIIGGWRIADGDNGIKIAPQQFGGRKKKKKGMAWDGMGARGIWAMESSWPLSSKTINSALFKPSQIYIF